MTSGGGTAGVWRRCTPHPEDVRRAAGAGLVLGLFGGLVGLVVGAAIGGLLGAAAMLLALTGGGW